MGSIGNNTDFYIASQDGVGLRFTNNQILPCSESGAIQTTSRDLGSSSALFRDLYLAGGIQFDSRSSKLDDYEEGTWTPAFQSTSATFSYASAAGNYTKVGRLVMLSFRLVLAANPSGTTSNTVYISGLPFSTATLGGTYHGGSIGHYFNIDLSQTGVLAYQTVSSTSTVELKVVGDNLGETAVLASHLRAASEIRGQIIYHTS